jgi:hypothetical protein
MGCERYASINYNHILGERGLVSYRLANLDELSGNAIQRLHVPLRRGFN